jgi:hypothetical protein
MLRAAVIVLFIALLPSHADAEARIALLIGNEAYASEIGRLANPHNDVALLEQALKGLGFEVTVARDAGLGALTRAVNAYGRRVQAAGPGAIGFFYYSGHGASDGSTNGRRLAQRAARCAVTRIGHPSACGAGATRRHGHEGEGEGEGQAMTIRDWSMPPAMTDTTPIATAITRMITTGTTGR